MKIYCSRWWHRIFNVIVKSELELRLNLCWTVAVWLVETSHMMKHWVPIGGCPPPCKYWTSSSCVSLLPSPSHHSVIAWAWPGLADDQYCVYYNIQTYTRALLLLLRITKKKLSWPGHEQYHEHSFFSVTVSNRRSFIYILCILEKTRQALYTLQPVVLFELILLLMMQYLLYYVSPVRFTVYVQQKILSSRLFWGMYSE